MDFDFHYTKEQEDFRKEVRAFIDENKLKEPRNTADQNKMTLEEWNEGLKNSAKMGEKGWFAPEYPKKYGGGGLDTDHCMILGEEFARIVEERRWLGSVQVSGIIVAGILGFASEELKMKVLPEIFGGGTNGAQCFTEPEAGTDEASQKSTCIRDGDHYVVNGTKVFVGSAPIGSEPFSYLYWTGITNPDRPRHLNLGAFLVPGTLPGISYAPLDLMGAEAPRKWEITCTDAHFPADRIVGEEGQGWQVAQGSLHVEHGGAGTLRPQNQLVPRFIAYCKKTMRNGKPLSSYPEVHKLLVELHAEHKIARLWGLRNYAMAQGQLPRVFYTGTQTALHGKRQSPITGKAIMDIIGPYCMIDDPKLQVLIGEVEHAVRMGDITHIAGTPETQQIMMSRALGLGRGTETIRT